MNPTTMMRRAALALALLAATASGARAAGPVSLIDPWSHAGVAGGTVAVYATIVNTGDEADRLIGATSPSAPAAEIHDPAHGSAAVTSLAIPAHGTVALAPAGPYVLLSGLKADVADGGLYFARLHFERAGWIVAIVRVRAGASATAPVPPASSNPVIPVPVIAH